jgi:hypothetical protein
MARGPICGETNPWYGRTPGPTGCNDAADPNNPMLEVELVSPMPLGLRPKVKGKAKPKSISEREPSKRKRSQADAVAKLTKPSDATIQQLSAALDNVRKLNKEYETSKKPKDEDLRLKKEKVVKDIVKAYGVGLTYVTGLEFSNRNDSPNHAETRGTFIIVFDGVLENPAFLASVIIHESSHAQRNAELNNAGVDSSRLSLKAQDIWSALKEFEGAQLEIDSAAKTGITETEKKAAMSLRDAHLAELETLMGKDTRKEIENGGLDDVRDRFIRQLKSRP